MTLTVYGIKEWGLGLIVTLILCGGTVFLALRYAPWTGWILTGLVLLCFFALAAFFRDPVRRAPADETLLVSPADGVVRDIEVVEFNQEPFQGQALRIGIFLSVFNVHVNRAPSAWKILSKQYRPGKYLDARSSGCVRENEAMTIAGIGNIHGKEFPLGVRQISGAIARRIVCPVEPGVSLGRAAVYGMIKFGSRTELYLPLDRFEVQVKIGDAVRGGETVMAKLK